MANKTMKTLTIAGNTYEIVDEAARADITNLKTNKINYTDIDTTLKTTGKVADAKATGDGIADAKKAGTDAATAASNAHSRADDAYDLAETAKDKADDAYDLAETAKDKADDAYTLASNAQTKTESLTLQNETVSLTVDGWSNNTQNVSVDGVTIDNTVIVSPAPDSYISYGESVIRCISQDSNTLTFQCDNVPTSEIIVNVIILAKGGTGV